jgi:hypothetical protein
MRTLATVVTLLAASTAGAVPVKIYKEASATAISAVAINSTAYTGWISVPTSRSVAFLIDYTYSAATAVTMSCEVGDDGSATNGAGNDVQILETPVGGTMTSRPAVWSQPIAAASEDWVWTVTNLPADYVNCWFDGTGADGSDVVTVAHRRITP